MTDCAKTPNGVDRRENCDHAEKAAEVASDKAVKKVFAILGVDVDKPEQVEQFRISLRFGDQLRKAFDKGFIVAAAVISTAIMAAIWAGISHKLGVD